MNRKISIVTPSYNQGQFIEDAIQSVINQNYPDFEHIIVDGESTDNTIDLLKKYPHLKWISEPDEGQSDALNKGFEMATGDIIGWLNADDYYLPGVFKKVNQEFRANNCSAIYANYKFVNKHREITGNRTAEKPAKWIALFQCFIPSTTFFFRRKIIEENIFIDKDFHITMDKEFFAHILHKGHKIKHVDDYFACFRWHDNNKSINTKKVKIQTAKEGLIILNRYSSLNIPINKITMRLYRICSKVVTRLNIVMNLIK